jgi:hypothetical protein
MSKKIQIEQDFIVDKLTDSILNTISGDSFQTEVSRMTTLDLKNVNKKMNGILIGNQNLKIYRKKFTN